MTADDLTARARARAPVNELTCWWQGSGADHDAWDAAVQIKQDDAGRVRASSPHASPHHHLARKPEVRRG